MRNGVATKSTCFLFSALGLALYAVAGDSRAAVAGEIHNVPGDFTTIQACIDAAVDGNEREENDPNAEIDLTDFVELQSAMGGPR